MFKLTVIEPVMEEFKVVIDTALFSGPNLFGPDSQTIYLLVAEDPNNDYTIDWGDGNVDRDLTGGSQHHFWGGLDNVADAPWHKYDEPGEYTITITGNYPEGIKFYNGMGVGESRLTKVLTPLPEVTADYGVRYTFQYCRNLESIPEDLYKNNPDETDFYSAFHSCNKLKNIPEGLFANNISAVNFGGAFQSCTSLKSIPVGLFANNTEATNFDGTFSHCSDLESIDGDLFASNGEAINFNGTFAFCTNLEEIPYNIFANNPKAESFRAVFRGAEIKSIPAGLFDNNLIATDFWGAFYQCYELITVPQNLFANTPNTPELNFDLLFCIANSKITSSLPELWITHDLCTTHHQAFADITNAPNWASVPTSWGNPAGPVG